MSEDDKDGLVVGARVRIDLGKGCPFQQTHNGPMPGSDEPLPIWQTLVPHQPAERGSTGTITYVNPTRHPAMSGHWWCVRLDTPIWSHQARQEQWTLDFAASELTVLAPADQPAER